MRQNRSNTSHSIRASYISCIHAFLLNLLLAYVIYMVCRGIFFLENYHLYKESWQQLSFGDIIKGGLLFDTSAILYTNALYALMMLLPLHLKERNSWQSCARGLFILVNSIAVILNLTDAVYFQYTGRRSTTSVFREFSNENNIISIASTELLNHWYLVLAGVLLIFCLFKLALKADELRFYSHGKTSIGKYYIIQVIALALFTPLCIAGMRGGFTTAVRPITISNANQYVNHPTEAAIVLNTPFSFIRTIGKDVFSDPKYFSQDVLDKLYQPIHNATADTTATSNVTKRKNVVVLIVESFGREYIGEYNKQLDGGKYKGYAPFIDEVLKQALTFNYSFGHGRQSIAGTQSIQPSNPT